MNLGRKPSLIKGLTEVAQVVDGNTTIFLSFSLSARYIAIIVFAVDPLEQ